MKLVLRHATLAIALLPVVAGCPKKSAEDKPAATQPAGETTPAAAPAASPGPAAANPPSAAGVSADLPPECTEYGTLVEKLKTCDKLGAARTALTQAYDNLRTAWATVPPDRRTEIAAQCKLQAESLRNAVAATCGL